MYGRWVLQNVLYTVDGDTKCDCRMQNIAKFMANLSKVLLCDGVWWPTCTRVSFIVHCPYGSPSVLQCQLSDALTIFDLFRLNNINHSHDNHKSLLKSPETFLRRRRRRRQCRPVDCNLFDLESKHEMWLLCALCNAMACVCVAVVVIKLKNRFVGSHSCYIRNWNKFAVVCHFQMLHTSKLRWFIHLWSTNRCVSSMPRCTIEFELFYILLSFAAHVVEWLNNHRTVIILSSSQQHTQSISFLVIFIRRCSLCRMRWEFRQLNRTINGSRVEKNVVPVPNNSRHPIYSILRSLFSGECDSSLHQHRHDGTDRRKCGKKHSVDSSNSLLLLFGVNMHSGNGLHFLSIVTITLAHTKFCEYFSVSFEKNEWHSMRWNERKKERSNGTPRRRKTWNGMTRNWKSECKCY